MFGAIPGLRNTKQKSAKVVKWKAVAKKLSGTTYDLHLMAIITHPWQIMSQHSSEKGPLPTMIIFTQQKNVRFMDVPKEIGNVKEGWEEKYKASTWYYTKAVDFVQRIEVNPEALPISIEGRLFYIACNNMKCLPATECKFKIEIV